MRLVQVFLTALIEVVGDLDYTVRIRYDLSREKGFEVLVRAMGVTSSSKGYHVCTKVDWREY